MAAIWSLCMTTHLNVICSSVLVFLRGWNTCKTVRQRTEADWFFTSVAGTTDMYVNPYGSCEALQFHPFEGGGGRVVGVVGENTAKCKGFPEKTSQNPHLYLQVISGENQRISLGCVSSGASASMRNADYFIYLFALEGCQLQTTSGATKKVWLPWATDVYVLDNEDSG